MNLGFLKIESFKRGILFSSAFNFLAKLLLFMQSIVIAYYFGTQAQTDIYFYCFTTVTLVCTFINALDTSVLIPESMRLSEQEGKEQSVKFLNFFIYCYPIVGVLVTVILLAFPVEIFGLFSKFDDEALESNKLTLMLAIPLFMLMATTNLLVNILTSYRFFTIPMIIGMINSSLVLLFLFFFHGIWSMQSVLVGQLIAYVLNVGFLLWLMRKNLNWDFSFYRVRIERRIIKNMLFAQAGNLTTLVVAYVPIYLLSGFGTGVVTSLTYGQKTSEMPNQLITMQFSSVAAIRFNELYARNEHARLGEIFTTIGRSLLFIMVPISCITFIYAHDIISILYERGSFDAASVKSADEFLRFFGLLLPFLALNTLVTRLLVAGHRISYAFYYQASLNALFILFIWIAIRYVGAVGYPIAMVAGYCVSVVAVVFLIRKVMPAIRYGDVLIYFLKIVLVNLLVAGLVYFLLANLGIFPSLVNLVLGTALYFGLIISINFAIKLDPQVSDLIRTGWEKLLKLKV